MAKGSVRKKGKKWYYRFYVEDASGNLVQKEFAGTENKSETEKLLRQAMEDYEAKRFVAKAENITLGELLDLWAEEELNGWQLSSDNWENQTTPYQQKETENGDFGTPAGVYGFALIWRHCGRFYIKRLFH